MAIDFAELVNIYPFPTGRRLFACRTVLARARARGLDDIVEPTEEALEHDRETLALESRWEAKQAGESPDDPLRYAELARAQERGQSLLARLVIIILGRYAKPHEGPAPLVDTLLDPITDQNEIIRGYRRRRQPTPDVDPVTGEALESI